MTYYSEPEEVTGYALDAEDSFWQVCLPQATRNLFKDPSFESGVAPNNGTLINTGMLGRQCVQSVFSGVSPNTNQIVNARFTPETTSVHTVSAHVRFVSPPFVRSIVIRVVNETVNPAVEISRDTHVITKRNQWVRISHTTRSALTAGTEYTLQILYSTPSNTRVFQVDCVQAEALPYATTYVDGDMALYVPEAASEYYWEGTPYNSISVRTNRTRTGGKLVALHDYGFRTLSVGGLGLVPFERQIERRSSRFNNSYNFQVGTRELTISGSLYGQTFGELSRKRVEFMNLFSPSAFVKEDDPILLRIQLNENDEPMDLMVRYVDGLEGEITNLHQQRISLRLTAIENPYLQGSYQSVVCNGLEGGSTWKVLVKNLETGEWIPYTWSDGIEGRINDIYIDDNRDIYVCGSMTGAVHKMNALGQTGATRLGSNLDFTGGGAVTLAATRIGGDLWIAVGGQLSIDATQVAVALWRENTNTWVSVLTNAQIGGGTISEIVFIANTLYVGGDFVATVGSNAESLLAVTMTRTSPTGISFEYSKPINFEVGAEVTALSAGPNNKLYIGGLWVSNAITGDSRVLIEENVITGEAQPVLPPLSRGLAGNSFPQTARQIVLDNNNRLYLLRYVSGGDHYLVYQGQAGANLGQSNIGYEDWSSNRYNLRIATSGQSFSQIAIDRKNNIYLSGPISALDEDAVFNVPVMRNSVVSRVWSHNFKITATPLDAYYLSMGFTTGDTWRYPIASKGNWLAVATHQSTEIPLRWGTPVNVTNNSSVPTPAVLLVTGPGDFVGLWNWTTGEQLVLDEPIVLQNKSALTPSASPYNLIGERIIIAQINNQYMYRYMDVADSQWTLVPINVAGTTKNALMLAPGTNSITSYVGRRLSSYNPQINPILVWRSQQGAL